MTRSLTGKVALVTGTAKGIGAGIAKAMSAAGASVVVNFASDRSGAERVVGEIEGAGGSAVAIQANLWGPIITGREAFKRFSRRVSRV
jgi:3-oxoacyl-[acyl-carrier protein] reductase